MVVTRWPKAMKLNAITFLVPDYEAGIAFFIQTLGFTLVEDTKLSETKRWVMVAPPGGGSHVLIAKASAPEQAAAIGKAAGGRCAFFLHCEEFAATRARLEARGITFLEDARHEPYGTVAQFRDPFGNVWDLIAPS